MARPRKIQTGLPSYCQRDRKTGKLWMYVPDETRKTGLRRQQYDDLNALLIAWRDAWGEVRRQGLSTVGHALDARLAECVTLVESGHLQASTLADYRIRHAKLFPIWKDVQIQDVDVPMLYDWRDARGKKAKITTNRERSFLYDAFKIAVRKGTIKQNPVADLEPFKEKPRDKYVTDTEFMQVYNVASPIVRAAMLVAVVTGLRQGDILRIRRADFSDAGLIVRTNKTGKSLVIKWTEGLRMAVIAAAESREFIPMNLIATEKGKAYTSSGFRSLWHKAYKQAGISSGFTFNDLRAKAGSDSLDWQLLGHTDRKTFERVYNRKPRHVSGSR